MKLLQEEVKNSHGRSSLDTKRDARMSGRNKPRIIRNCKKDINLAFLPNQIKESFVSLSQICYSKKKE